MNRRFFLQTLAASSAISQSVAAFAPPETKVAKKKILIIGDYIKNSYVKKLAEIMADRAEIITPEENCGNSLDVLRQLEGWLKKYDPDLVAINTGFEDMRTIYYGSYENLVPPKLYSRNVKHILEYVYLFSSRAIPFWITTSPVEDEQHTTVKAKVRDYTVFNEDVLTYNRIAMKECRKFKVSVIDLYNHLSYSNLPAMVEADGYHLSAKGRDSAAKAIFGHIENYL